MPAFSHPAMRERAQPNIQPFGQPRTLAARVAGIDDYNRLHQNELSHLPGVIRLETGFALRDVLETGRA